MSSDIDVSALRAAAEREIADGLAACQVAVARDGEVVYFESFGSADDDTRFGVASATKPIVASATWHLIGEGLLDLDRRVVDYVPEFGTHGKDVVTVEQVYLMTCGFPTAPMEATEGADPARRVARFADWELEYEPGTQYVYHGGSAHWVLAELIERLGGMDFRDYVEARVTRPLGLPRLLGIPRAEQTNIAQFSLPSQPETRPGYDRAAMIEAGIPGGGGVMTAATLARFYQGVLHNPNGLWKPDVLADATIQHPLHAARPHDGAPRQPHDRRGDRERLRHDLGQVADRVRMARRRRPGGIRRARHRRLVLVPAEWRRRPDQRVRARDQDVGARARTGPLTPPRGRTCSCIPT